MKSFAIVLVCYNRLDGMRRLLSSLEKVDFGSRNDIELIFSIDYGGTPKVLDFALKYNWPFGHKTIRAFHEKQGLKEHVLQCGDFLQQYDILVVLEDDLFVSDSLYFFASQAAEYYWDDDRIAGISLYSFQKNWLNWILRFEPQKSSYDVFFLKIAMSWGQVWTRNKWMKFKEWYDTHKVFEKKDSLPYVLNMWGESSWLKYHDRYCIETNRYFVCPYTSISTNCCDAGEHNSFPITDYQVELQFGKKDYSFVAFSKNSVVYDEFMEREFLGKYINIDDNELTVDLWGNKPRTVYSKYLLTTEDLPCRLIRSFGLVLRPAELNIIADYSGDDIKLYEYKNANKHKSARADLKRYLYSMRSHDYNVFLFVGFSLLKQRMKKFTKHFFIRFTR